MDSDTKKLLDWQKRVVETMFENAGGGSPYAYIWQSKWDKLKAEALEMQEALQPRRWTVEIWVTKGGSISPTIPGLYEGIGNGAKMLGRGVIVEGEGLDA